MLLPAQFLPPQLPPAHITVQARMLTYRDLCAALTIQGHPTACSDAVADRLALVSLRDRSWDDAKAILTKALSIDFRAGSDGSVVMVRDQADTDREAADLGRYVGRVDGRAHAVFAEASRLAEKYPPGAEAGSAALRTIAVADSENGFRSVRSAAALFLMGTAQYPPVDPLAAYVFMDGGGLRRLIRGDVVAYGLGETNMAPGLPAWVRFSQALDPDARRHTLFLQRASFDPLDGSVRYGRWASQSAYEPFGLRQVGEFEQIFVPSSLYERTSALGPAFDPKALPAAPKAISGLGTPIDLGPGLRSVAVMLGTWAEQTRTDVAMEVSSVRDRIYMPPPGGRGSVAPYLWPSASSGPGRAGAIEKPATGEDSLSQAYQTRVRRAKAWAAIRCWRPEQVAGALVVRNDLSFLDRQYGAPFGALLPPGGATVGRLRTPLTLAEIVAACGKVDPKADASLSRLDLAWTPDGFVRFMPFGRSMAALPPEDLEAALKELDERGETAIKLPSAARGVLRDSAASHARSAEDPEASRTDLAPTVLGPSFAAALTRSSLSVTRQAAGEGTANYEVRLLGRETPTSETKVVLSMTLKGVGVKARRQ